MKNLKRNIIIAAVLLLVCAAVYLNWSYNRAEAGDPGKTVDGVDTETSGDAHHRAPQHASWP